jgi:hypothetical protein
VPSDWSTYPTSDQPHRFVAGQLRVLAGVSSAADAIDCADRIDGAAGDSQSWYAAMVRWNLSLPIALPVMKARSADVTELHLLRHPAARRAEFDLVGRRP